MKISFHWLLTVFALALLSTVLLAEDTPAIEKDVTLIMDSDAVINLAPDGTQKSRPTILIDGNVFLLSPHTVAEGSLRGIMRSYGAESQTVTSPGIVVGYVEDGSDKRKGAQVFRALSLSFPPALDRPIRFPLTRTDPGFERQFLDLEEPY